MLKDKIREKNIYIFLKKAKRHYSWNIIDIMKLKHLNWNLAKNFRMERNSKQDEIYSRLFCFLK
jgi:hypothetical protein